MQKINKTSQAFSLLFRCLFVLYPVFIIAYWLGGLSLPEGYFAMSRIPIDIALNTIRLDLRLYACLVYMIPTAIVMLSFHYLSKLFHLYARNIIFSYENVDYIRKLGMTLLLETLAFILVQPILTIILTWDAPKGQHIMAIGFSGDDLSYLVIAGIVLLISWVMEEGRKLEEDRALTV